MGTLICSPLSGIPGTGTVLLDYVCSRHFNTTGKGRKERKEGREHIYCEIVTLPSNIETLFGFMTRIEHF